MKAQTGMWTEVLANPQMEDLGKVQMQVYSSMKYDGHGSDVHGQAVGAAGWQW